MEGYSDWRLPSYDDLCTIVDHDKYDPAIMPSFKNVSTSDGYWSSFVSMPDNKNQWAVLYFKSGGGTLNDGRFIEYYVRCVRSRQSL